MAKSWIEKQREKLQKRFEEPVAAPSLPAAAPKKELVAPAPDGKAIKEREMKEAEKYRKEQAAEKAAAKKARQKAQQKIEDQFKQIEEEGRRQDEMRRKKLRGSQKSSPTLTRLAGLESKLKGKIF